LTNLRGADEGLVSGGLFGRRGQVGTRSGRNQGCDDGSIQGGAEGGRSQSDAM